MVKNVWRTKENRQHRPLHSVLISFALFFFHTLPTLQGCFSGVSAMKFTLTFDWLIDFSITKLNLCYNVHYDSRLQIYFLWCCNCVSRPHSHYKGIFAFHLFKPNQIILYSRKPYLPNQCNFAQLSSTSGQKTQNKLSMLNRQCQSPLARLPVLRRKSLCYCL